MQDNEKGKKIKTITIVITLALTILWGLHSAEVLNANPDTNVISALVQGIFSIFKGPLKFRIDMHSLTAIINNMIAIGGALVVYAVIFVLLWVDAQRHQHFDKETACGSAKWNTDLKQYNKKYSDPFDLPTNDGPENMILTSDVFLNLNGHITKRNNNVTVVGGSGSGKTRYFIKPNILQANCNYVITDPKGDLLKTTGSFLKSQGYDIKVFNLVEMWKSDCYNPFNYIRDDLGVVMMIKCLIKNTTPPGQKAGDPFWEKSEEALLQALCFYLVHHREKKYHNFSTVMRLLRLAEVDEKNPSFKSPLDKLFDDVEKADPNSIALKQYKTFKMGAGKTLKSILISCSVRLTVFNLNQIENLTGKDTIELDKMGEGKKALYVIIPSADSTYNFLVSMMYSQLFETLYFMAETQYENNRLKSRVRFLLDEFANIGEIPEFTKKLATMRQYEISCSIILQNLAQIKAMYKDDWQSILGNCDSFLFLGGQEFETVEYISKELGEQTIVTKNRSMSNGKSSSASQSYQTTSRKLMTPDELIHLDENECILMIRALNPFKTRKYDYPKHPNYKYTGDASANNVYVNEKDNRVMVTAEKIDIQEEREKAAQYAEAEKNPSPSTRVIGEIKNIEGFCKSLGVKDEKDAKERFVAVPLAETNPATEETSIKDIINDIDNKEVKTKAEIEVVPVIESVAVTTNDNQSTQGDSIATDVTKESSTEVKVESEVEAIAVATVDNEQTTQGEAVQAHKHYSNKPSEKTLMKREKITTGAPILKDKESDQEIWDFD